MCSIINDAAFVCKRIHYEIMQWNKKVTFSNNLMEEFGDV